MVSIMRVLKFSHGIFYAYLPSREKSSDHFRSFKIGLIGSTYRLAVSK